MTTVNIPRCFIANPQDLPQMYGLTDSLGPGSIPDAPRIRSLNRTTPVLSPPRCPQSFCISCTRAMQPLQALHPCADRRLACDTSIEGPIVEAMRRREGASARSYRCVTRIWYGLDLGRHGAPGLVHG